MGQTFYSPNKHTHLGTWNTLYHYWSTFTQGQMGPEGLCEVSMSSLNILHRFTGSTCEPCVPLSELFPQYLSPDFVIDSWKWDFTELQNTPGIKTQIKIKIIYLEEAIIMLIKWSQNVFWHQVRHQVSPEYCCGNCWGLQGDGDCVIWYCSELGGCR